MIKNYLKIAWRNIIKHKVFSLINVIGLTIGFSAALIIGMMVYYEYTFDDFHKDEDSIYRVVTNFKDQEGMSYNSGVTVALEDAIKDNTNLDVVAGFYIERPSSVENSSQNIKLKWPKNVIFAKPSYFDIFQYTFLVGDKNTALLEPNNVVLTEDRAALYFPKMSPEQIIGKTLVYNDNLNVKVTGVVANFKGRTDFIFEEFLSAPTALNTRIRGEFINNNWNSTSDVSQLFIKAGKNANLAYFETTLNALADEHLDDYSRAHNQSRTYSLQPLRDIHFNDDYGIYDWTRTQASKPLLRNLSLVALFLLLLGCINFINLNTAQASQRAKEIGVRKTLGSSKKQLIRQFMGETFILVLFSALLSIFLSRSLIHVFSDFIPEGLSFQLLASPTILLGIVVLLIIVTLLSGFYPALVLSNFNTIEVLKNNFAVGEKKARLRKFLTVFQFTIAQVFIIAMLLVGKQINFLLTKDMGFKTDAIVSIRSPRSEPQLAKKELFVEKLKAIPEIKSLSLGGAPPASISSNTTTTVHNNGINVAQTDLQFLFGDTNYAALYELEILAGRKPLNDTIKELVINEAARKIYGFKTPEEALGKEIDFGDHKVPVVGVMANFHQRSLRSAINPMAYRGDWERDEFSRFRMIHIALYTTKKENLEATLSKIKSAYGSVYTEIEDYRLNFMDETIANFYNREQRVAKLLNWATGLSIVISCLGLLGLVMYTTNRRIKEIGIRKVLGASVGALNALLCKEFLILVGAAFLIAAPFSYWGLHYWLQDFAYKTEISWWVFVLSAFIILFISLGIMSIRTIATALKNPINSLRTE